MSINMETTGIIPYKLAPTDQFQVTIDISTWLDSDTIDTVVFSAVDGDDTDTTSTVIVSASCTYTDTQVRAYIKGGEDGEGYTMRCRVTTAQGHKKTFYIKWTCDE